MRADFDWQASSNGKKCLSAATELMLLFGRGRADEDFTGEDSVLQNKKIREGGKKLLKNRKCEVTRMKI